MAKTAHRFDYGRFAEARVERGLIDHDVLKHVFQQCNHTRSLLPEVLVRENLVSDWEVSRVACELYHLPFLTVDQYPPAGSALDGYDLNYLRHYALVPLDRYGALVTVIMPGLVPSEVLEGLRAGQSGRVLPLVGSVVSNRRWLEQHAPIPGAPLAQAAGPQAKGAAHQAGAKAVAKIAAPLPSKPIPVSGEPQELKLANENEEDWSNIFDAGDEAVRLDLPGPPKKPR